MNNDTIPEMAKRFSTSYDDDPTNIHKYENAVSFHLRCTVCGQDTVPLDPRYPNNERVCLRCLMKSVAHAIDYASEWACDYDPEMSDYEYEMATLKAKLDKASEAVVDAQKELREVKHQLTSTKLINETIKDECDELRKRVENFDDDTQALHNNNARLKLEVDKWKALATRRPANSC